MLSCSVYAQPGGAEDAAITTEHVEQLARFEEASALAVDPTGRLYVTDAGADVVVQFAPDGSVLARVGGPDTFDEPADVDPTNGLAIFVADAGNARLQRFARAFRFLEAIPVGGTDGRAAPSVYDRAGGEGSRGGTGRPVAVASTGADEVYAIDAAAGHVVRWTPRRRTQHVVGGFGDGSGALEEPVALALGPEGRLYVADRARSAVVVFDAFGSFLTTIAEGEAAESSNLLFVDEQLWLVRPGGVKSFDARGRAEGERRVHLGAPLIDAAHHRGTTYLLTTDALYRLAR